MMMNRILDIWSDIERSNEIGLLKRLYTNEPELRIYAISQNPEGHCGIALSYSRDIKVDISPFSTLRDLQVAVQTDSSYVGNNLLIIQLQDSQNRDVFSVMCENMVESVLPLKSEKDAIRVILNQLEKWQTLFERMKGEGLSLSEQLGLFGELHFLQKCLAHQDAHKALCVWVGTDKAIRDFQYEKWAVEVKTTAGNNHQRVSVSSERQLDETLLETLFLYHLSVEASKKNGESLVSKIDTIRNGLKGDVSALNLFNNKLIDVGYFEKHAYLYEEKSYLARNESYYHIEGDFPRIKEQDIRDGIGDVKYSIILSRCDKYLVAESTVLKTICGI